MLSRRRSSVALSEDYFPIDLLFGFENFNEEIVVDSNSKKRKRNIDNFRELSQTPDLERKKIKPFKEENCITNNAKKNVSPLVVPCFKGGNKSVESSSTVIYDTIPCIVSGEEELEFFQVSKFSCNEQLSSFERVFSNVVELVNQVNKDNQRGCSQHCNPFEDMFKLLQP
ncbi:hypothetical protein ABK040_004733 [Willaertia magna]